MLLRCRGRSRGRRATPPTPQQSRLEFVGVQAGAEFKGVFHKFTATVDFAPEALASSRIDVQIDMNSVDSLDKDRDTTIRGKDVFDVAHYPTAHYVTKSITKTAAGFSAVGALTLHGVTKDVPIEFQFAPGAAGAKLSGSAKLKRLDFGVGQGDWKSTEYRRRCRENQFLLGAEAQGLDMPRSFDDVAECVENTLSRVGSRIVLALPLGIGKPNPLANEFYRRARRDPALAAHDFHGLEPARSAMEGRARAAASWNPWSRGCSARCVPLDYVTDLHGARRAGECANRRILSGSRRAAQCRRTRSATMSAPTTRMWRATWRRRASMSSRNSSRNAASRGALNIVWDRTRMSRWICWSIWRRSAAPAETVVVIGEINRQMPFMFGPAAVAAETFDSLIEHPRYDYDLFAPPNQRLNTADYAIGLYGARLVRDGGTLQIGIGELGDAVVYGLQLRHQQNVGISRDPAGPQGNRALRSGLGFNRRRGAVRSRPLRLHGNVR